MSLRALARHQETTVHTLSARLRAAGHEPRSRAEATKLQNVEREWGPSRANHPAAARKVYDRKRLMVREYRETRGCQDCGENHPAILDLHHTDPSTKHPSLRSRQVDDGTGRRTYKGWMGMSFADIETELQKCIVLCSNCHKKRHWEESNT